MGYYCRFLPGKRSMCPECACVIIVDDDPDAVVLGHLMVERGGHSVVGVIRSPQDFDPVVLSLTDTPHAALVDKHLSHDSRAEEGVVIGARLRDKFPDIVILDKPFMYSEVLAVLASL